MSTTFADPSALSHDQLEEGTAFAPRFDAVGVFWVASSAMWLSIVRMAHE